MLYVYLVTALLLLIIPFIPKKMQKKDIYIIWITVVCVEVIADLLLWNVMGLYYFAGDERLSVGVVLIKLLTAPMFGVLFINFMPKEFLRFIVYWLFWVAFSTFFEWTVVYSGYLTYTGWNLWFSAIFYLIIIPILRLHYYYIKH
ncbi:hypothetical protein [Halalkalibacter okhensis]|uniref:Uncharacterized protein n=1 Tax=Halalkalibacter okhensis TaxID=333138 RepID=A0A0B0IP66_9BACI|nr:hypothetical protein [Halalkalibacter okhensis]KHF41456.1 hypothetical protein LQ50_04325 [Halalkalibacter okhensis]